MNVVFKITQKLHYQTMADLRLHHGFAFERVGFFLCRPAELIGGLLLIAQGFHKIADADYVKGTGAGATMGTDAIRKALQTAYTASASMFHVHIHEHTGKPSFSRMDEIETSRFVPDFWHVQPKLPHGAIVLSKDSAYGKCWIAGNDTPIEIGEFASIGVPMRRL
jgi:hypothetical protein